MDTEITKERAPPPPYSVEPSPPHTVAPGPSTHFNPPYPPHKDSGAGSSHIPPPGTSTHFNPAYPNSEPVSLPGNQPTTIVVQHVENTKFGTKSQFARCGNCGAQSFTKTESKPNGTTHMIALILCCFILWPCAWIPYVCSSCQSTHHYCSNCNQFLGERQML